MAAKSTLKYTPSLIVGLLLVPLSAVVAYAMVAKQPAPGAAESAPPATSSTTVMTPAEIVVTSTTAPEVDLIAACGVDGMSLVVAEADGTITPVQQAALDALRPICAAAGADLPAPPAPPSVIRAVTVSGGGSGAPGSGNLPGEAYDDDDREDREDRDDERSEREDRDHEDEEDDHEEDD